MAQVHHFQTSEGCSDRLRSPTRPRSRPVVVNSHQRQRTALSIFSRRQRRKHHTHGLCSAKPSTSRTFQFAPLPQRHALPLQILFRFRFGYFRSHPLAGKFFEVLLLTGVSCYSPASPISCSTVTPSALAIFTITSSAATLSPRSTLPR